MTTAVMHSKASWVIKSWRAPEVGSLFDVKLEDEFDGCTLVFPGHLGWRIAVYFTKIRNRPDVMRVRSSNYRCEDEPNGVYPVEACREFYRTLRAAGMQVEA